MGINFDSFDGQTLTIWKMVERKDFLANPKHLYHVSHSREHDCSAQSQKQCRLLLESMFDSFDRQALIIRKIMEGKTLKLFMQIESINHVSQCGEHDYSA